MDPRPEIDVLLTEGRTLAPSQWWLERSRMHDASVYARAAADPEQFWAPFATELEWSRPWTKILDWQPPHAKWFVGGKNNASVNCLDRHLSSPRRNKAALIWEGEPAEQRTLTYFELHRHVCKFANVLK